MSYASYQTKNGWDKLDFLATVKDNGKHIVNIQHKIFTETIRKNTLVFSAAK